MGYVQFVQNRDEVVALGINQQIACREAMRSRRQPLGQSAWNHVEQTELS